MRTSVSRRAFFHALTALGIGPAAVALPRPPRVEPQPDRRPRRGRGRHAVYVSILPPDFEPACGGVPDVTDLPICFKGPAMLIDCGLSLKSATRRAHAFNRQQLAKGIPGREWAYVVSYLREEKIGGLPT